MEGNWKKLVEFDREHIWHPYTSMTDPLPVYPVKSANGCEITLTSGEVLIDGMSSWWSAIHGYNHPVMIEAIERQARTLPHIMFGGLTHEPAVDLARLLVDISPKGLDKVFYSDSGSVAVEVAMKMAIQYQYCLGKRHKNRFLTVRGGYHGDTFHAMSVCDPFNGMHSLSGDVLPAYYFADKPSVKYGEKWDQTAMDSMRKLFEKHHETICAVIIEPVVQGAGGMNFYHPSFLSETRTLCDKYDVLFIADEIATGLGRTGKMFGCEHAEIAPDIMCLGKTLTGGYMSFAATLATGQVAEGVSRGQPGVFMHGPTYMGNPLGCRVSWTSVQLLLESNWQENISRIELQMKRELACCKDIDWVRDVRSLGGIGVVELECPVDQGRIQRKFIERGVWIRPFGRLVYLMPPYIISGEQLGLLTRALFEEIKDRKNMQ